MYSPFSFNAQQTYDQFFLGSVLNREYMIERFELTWDSLKRFFFLSIIFNVPFFSDFFNLSLSNFINENQQQQNKEEKRILNSLEATFLSKIQLRKISVELQTKKEKQFIIFYIASMKPAVFVYCFGRFFRVF